jgi:hypothetical protein
MTRDPFEPAALALSGSADGVALTPPAQRLPLLVQARLLGGYQWIERRLFEVLGAWVESESLPEAQLLFDVYSQQHAWHAELFAERMPVVDAVDAEALTVPPNRAIEQMFTELAGPSVAAGGHPSGRRPGGGTLLRLVGLSRVVLPRLVTGYDIHQRRAGTVSDAPLLRSFRFVLQDEIEQWQAVEALAQTLLRRPNDVAVVTAHQEHLEAFVAEQGPGLAPWPEPEGPPDDSSPGEHLDGAVSGRSDEVPVEDGSGGSAQVSEVWTVAGENRRS